MPARRAQGLLQFEVAFRTPPAAAARAFPWSRFDVARDPRRQANPTIKATPLGEKSDKGDPTASGSIASIFDLRSCGNWLKGLLGAPTVGKAVTTQPVNVTGVTVNYAAADCTSGNGTLTFVAVGTTITWTPQGGVAGAPVNIGAGGVFTVEGGGGGKSVNLSVTAGALPVANQNDATINVHATLKAHAFPFNLVDRPSMLIERGELDLAKFYRFLGCKVNTLGWDVLENEQNLAIGIIPAVEVDPVPGVVFDGAPTSYAAVRACSGGGRVWDGSGTGLGTLVACSVGFDNQMTPYPAADGLDGYGVIDEGDIMLSGTLRALFENNKAYDLARAGTSTRMRLQSTALNGADTFGVFIDMPNVELGERMPPREGKSGLFADLTWRAHGGVHAPVVVLVNDVAAY